MVLISIPRKKEILVYYNKIASNIICRIRKVWKYFLQYIMMPNIIIELNMWKLLDILVVFLYSCRTIV